MSLRAHESALAAGVDGGGGGGGGGDHSAHGAVGEALQVIVEAVAKMQVDMLRMNVKVGRAEEVAQLMVMGLRVHQNRVKRMEVRLEVVEQKLPSPRRRREKGTEPRREAAEGEAETQRAEASVQASMETTSESAHSLAARVEPPQRSRRGPLAKPPVAKASPPCARSSCGRASPPPTPPPAIFAGAAPSPRALSCSASGSGAGASGASGGATASALGALLLKAAQEGSLGDVRALLRRGADIDFQNASRWTPLHMATRRARDNVVVLLAEKGANVNARTSYGYAAVHLAARHDFSGRCVLALAGAGAGVNCRNQFGRTPLHLAAECGNELAVMRLLVAGANRAARNDDGKTPLEVAKTEAVRGLLLNA